LMGSMGERSGDSLRNLRIEKSFANRHFFPPKPPNHGVIPNEARDLPRPIQSNLMILFMEKINMYNWSSSYKYKCLIMFIL
jgi:hypothetical protein